MISKQIKTCLLDWGIERLFTITMDNASGNDSTIRHLTNKLKTWRGDALLLNSEFLHVRCCAHILNLIANEGLGKVDKSIVSIHNVVKCVRSSTATLQAFKICVEQEKILGPNGQISRGSVILDCPTRWIPPILCSWPQRWDLREVMIRKMFDEWLGFCGFFMMQHWHFLFL